MEMDWRQWESRQRHNASERGSGDDEPNKRSFSIYHFLVARVNNFLVFGGSVEDENANGLNCCEKNKHFNRYKDHQSGKMFNFSKYLSLVTSGKILKNWKKKIYSLVIKLMSQAGLWLVYFSDM